MNKRCTDNDSTTGIYNTLVKSTLPYLPRGKQAKEPCEKTILKTQASSLNPSLY